MIDVNIIGVGNIGEVTINGSMTVQNVTELKTYLVDLFKDY